MRTVLSLLYVATFFCSGIMVLSYFRMVYFQLWLLFYWGCHTRMPQSFIFLKSINSSFWPSKMAPSQVPSPPIFSFSVWISIAWSLSLIISLVCTVIATLLRQWARRHVQITQESRGARSRARVCELIAQGVEIPQFRGMSLVLLGLFHLSVGLFLSGFVSSINDNVVFLVTLAVTSICIALYYFVSVVPLSSHFHISYTPFSSLAWFCWSRIVWLTYTLLYNSSLRLPFIRYRTQQHLWELARERLSWTLRGSKVTIEDLARKRSSSLDVSVVSRIFDSLDRHEDMDQFLSIIPGFYSSGEVNKDSSVLEGLSDRILAPAIVSFLDHSLSSNLLTEDEIRRRITICLQAMNTDLLLLQCTFRKALQTLNSDIFKCIDFVSLTLKYLRNDNSDPWVKDFAQCILAVSINRISLDAGDWPNIVDRYLEPRHSQYLREGHDTRLCNLIYLIRQLKVSRLKSSDQFKLGGLWGNVLVEALKFEIMKTANDLQFEFRDLLDELRSMASSEVQPSDVAQSNAGFVLSSIHTAFVPHTSTTASTHAFFSSAGDQGPVFQWLASYPPHNVQEVLTRADFDTNTPRIPTVTTRSIHCTRLIIPEIQYPLHMHPSNPTKHGYHREYDHPHHQHLNRHQYCHPGHRMFHRHRLQRFLSMLHGSHFHGHDLPRSLTLRLRIHMSFLHHHLPRTKLMQAKCDHRHHILSFLHYNLIRPMTLRLHMQAKYDHRHRILSFLHHDLPRSMTLRLHMQAKYDHRHHILSFPHHDLPRSMSLRQRTRKKKWILQPVGKTQLLVRVRKTRGQAKMRG